MLPVFWVAFGGAVGSAVRYGVNQTVGQVLGESFPWATLTVNIVGSFAMGLITAFMLFKMPQDENIRLFLTTGLLGGFTTFSAFSLDVFNLMQRGENQTAALYAVASVGLSIVAVFAGLALSRFITG
jgi:fluoride exporter